MNNTLLAGTIVLLGSIIGALGSIYGGKISTDRNIKAQNMAIQEQRDLERIRVQDMNKTYARLIYNDLSTALYEGLMLRMRVKKIGIPNSDISRESPMLPMFTEYGKAIAALTENFSADELMMLNKLYAMIEEIRHNVLQFNRQLQMSNVLVPSYRILEIEVFKGEVYADMANELLESHTKDITVNYIMNQLTEKYKTIFDKLTEISGT